LGYLPEGYRAPRRTTLLERFPGLQRWALIALGLAVVAAAATTVVIVVARHFSGGPAAGDAALAVHVSTEDGQPASTAALDQTKRILLSRLAAAKVSRPNITVLGTDTLLVTVAPENSDQVRALLATGSLAFRLVLGQVPGKASATPAGCPAVAQSHVDMAAILASTKAKLGAQYDLAATMKSPDAADPAALTGFASLSCTEVSALPAQMQYVVPGISCAMLDGRLPGGLAANPTQQVTACDSAHTKYLLDAAKVGNTDLASATAGFDIKFGGWYVGLHFTRAGQAKFFALTQQAVDKGTAEGQLAMIATTMDNQVLTAPSVAQAINDDAIISGTGIDRNHAEAYAADFSSGVLPVTLTITAIQRVN
jgi:preprotein translocase subunit SecD